MLVDILAGLVCGLFMGTISLGAAIFIFVSNRDIYDWLAKRLTKLLPKRLPQGIPPTLVMLSLVIGLPGLGVMGSRCRPSLQYFTRLFHRSSAG